MTDGSMLKELFSRKRQDADRLPPVSYDKQKLKLQHRDSATRQQLASAQNTRPEILFYLAKDPAADVRKAIAGNEATPVQADEILAADVDEMVRCCLAEKIARLVPDMPADEQEKVRDLTIQILERLASDQLPKVRAVVAENLKHAENVPRHIVRRLAEDVETIVAAPVLQFSPLLSDDDLLEIIAIGKADGALSAIAKRDDVTPDLADAVARKLDVSAVAALLANTRAMIREDTLDRIIDSADRHESWHEPLVRRPTLSMGAVRRISSFVAASLIELLATRNDLDAETAAELAETVGKSLEAAAGADGESEEVRAQRLFDDGGLDDERMVLAIEGGEQDFVTEAIGLLSGLGRPRAQHAATPRSGWAKRRTPIGHPTDLRASLRQMLATLACRGRDHTRPAAGADPGLGPSPRG